ncbi:aldo/keto reductase [Halomonas urmiana]|uniref:aldo/keto reductase n=1 Tax=Halomonas urmiana TaxID=490901 RepID=UPI0030840B4E
MKPPPPIGLITAYREASTALVAFSPLGRGFLAGAVNDPARLEENDMRRGMPRFSAENHAHNLRLLEAFTALAEERGMTPGQLALAWLRAQGDEILPIPGSRNIDHMRENLAAEHHPPGTAHRGPAERHDAPRSGGGGALRRNPAGGSRYRGVR